MFMEKQKAKLQAQKSLNSLRPHIHFNSHNGGT